MRVCIAPFYRGADQGDGGIRRVVEAQQRYLPEFGITPTDDVRDADLIVCHGATLAEYTGVPMIAHCHGMMWSSYDFGDWGDGINKHVIDVLIRAQAITAPSHWVAHAISRGMLVKPEVIYHGVDAGEWQHDKPSLGYVLWNKARVDPVSDPADMNEVASLLPDVPFLSTFGEPAPNVRTLGSMPYGDMRGVVQQAGVYLATARETMGIGTLEALAAGVPVVGWRYGGQAEIVIEGETGYLAEYGDYETLASYVERCLQDRERLGANARADALARWGWHDKIGQYAALYERVVERWREPRPRVSVVVTCHNLAHYLQDAVRSVQEQTLDDWELLIVDDASTDNTALIGCNYAEGHAIQKKLPDVPARPSPKTTIRYLPTPSNLKLSGARNYGWQHATGKYIIFLDADDMLAPNALDQLAQALDYRSDLHIVYGRLDTINDQGEERKRNPFPSGDFSWYGQMAHLNQLPYASMMRREVLERSGGYRARDWRSEDAALWCRLTSFGFRAACVTDDTTLIYRMRSDSKSRGEDGDGDWTAWYPWRLAGTAKEGLQAIERKAQPNPQVVPFGAQGQPPKHRKAWPVHHHQHPAVSIIIPVGPGHAQYLIDALDSVQAQTIPDWECLVVNDTGAALDVTGSPWARVIDGGGLGAGGARNAALRASQAPLVTFLDADDMLVPRALEMMLEAYTMSEGRYVYSDWLSLEAGGQWDGPYGVHESPDYDPQLWLSGMQHPVTILAATDDIREIGGFDEAIPAWEDWDLMIKQAIAGHEGVRVDTPLLIYRLHTGQRRKASKKAEEKLYKTLHDRYAGYISGELAMGQCCGGNAGAQLAAQNALASLMPEFFGGEEAAPAPAPVVPEKVRLEYVGDQLGATTWICPSGRQYRAGREQGARFLDVDPPDAEHLLRFEVFDRAQMVENAA